MSTWLDGTSTGRTGAELEKRWINAKNILSYGALGDDDDDTAAIQSAVADLEDGDTLYFPRGKFRFTEENPTGDAAILLDGLSNLTVWFAPGAELLMDNLDGSGEGTSHGVFVKGACSNVKLVNVRVRWRTVPSARSLGNGFNILGYPSESDPPVGWTGTTGTCTGVELIDCQTLYAPQCGAIFMGADRPVVVNFRSEGTLADGLHFNACRDPRSTGYTSFETEDDALALVTYYGDSDTPDEDVYGNQDGPFSQLTLNEWCNGGGQMSATTARGGSANGVRLAGVYNASVTGVSVTGKSVGIITDSGEAGGAFSWTYLASRNVSVVGAALDDCSTGILARVYNSDSGDDEKFWRYSAVFSDIAITNCSTRCLRTQGSGSGQNTLIAGLTFKGIRATGAPVSFSSLRESVIDDISVRSSYIEFNGQDNALTGAMSTLPRHNLVIGSLFADVGGIYFQDLNGIQVASVRSHYSGTDGVFFTRVKKATIGQVEVVLPNRDNTGTVRALNIAKGQRLTILNYELDHDANTTTTFSAVEIGGGDGTDVSSDVEILRSRYYNTINGTGSGVTIQGGGNAPVRWFLAHEHYNGGEASPIWRAAYQGSPALPRHFIRAGSPASNQIAPIGSTAVRTDGGEDTVLYVKESGTDATGWTAIPDA